MIRATTLVGAAITLLTAVANGAPAVTNEITIRQDLEYPDSASCDVTQICHTNFAQYDVHVGQPYLGSTGCNDVYNSIIASVGINDFTCDDDGFGGTMLKFAAGNDLQTTIHVIAGLQIAYPAVPFDGGGDPLALICAIPSTGPQEPIPACDSKRDLGSIEAKFTSCVGKDPECALTMSTRQASFQCYDITCIPGASGDEQCLTSPSKCGGGCSAGGKCVAPNSHVLIKRQASVPCNEIYCIPGTAGTKQCRNSASKCGGGCSGRGVCAA